jgi:hypothetical protein
MRRVVPAIVLTLLAGSAAAQELRITRARIDHAEDVAFGRFER